MLEMIKNDPVLPCFWGRNQSGMQAKEELDPITKQKAIEIWLKGRDQAVAIAEELSNLGVHKQIANRVTEPWMFITVILTATEFDNWFALRNHPDAQPEIHWLAESMFEQYETSIPQELKEGEWHLPLITNEDWDLVIKENGLLGINVYQDVLEKMKKISTGRCARVSYLTHDGKRDYNEDIKLHDKLCLSNPPHMSPFEHIAQALNEPKWIGNFIGWKQYRKEFENEHFGGSLENRYEK